ncbi:hypothetical protein PILCRDRAFT_218837 [Piloderma croceum F 1598]|uniref:DUF6534 domain-containing protein n=1 Tax=Piloderma croceum (strain F 1598) TaxID=765440 RepID=A0A0C3FYL2_PILCF|nr:hypothetical protein PILCRDRAFT_218837 [Piloderma croceum F 1598]
MSSPLPTAAPSLQELESTLGVLFIGFLVCIILYGFTFFQTYLYFSRFPKDNLWIKLTTGILCALDTTTSALISQAVYYYLIDQFLSPVGLLDATSTFCAENGLAILATFIVQVFYAARIYQIGPPSRPLFAIISLTAVMGCGWGIVMTVQIFQRKRLADLGTPWMEVVAGISQGFVTLADIMIVGALALGLRRTRNPRMRAPEGWFDKFVTYFINRLVCVTIVQVAYVCVFLAMPSKQIWIPFHLVVSKLYVNTLLAMLNSRDALQGRGLNEEETTVLSSHKTSNCLTSSSGVTNSAPVRFNVTDTKLQSLNIEVSQTVDMERHDSGKAAYGDDPDGRSLGDDQDAQKAVGLMPETV